MGGRCDCSVVGGRCDCSVMMDGLVGESVLSEIFEF